MFASFAFSRFHVNLVRTLKKLFTFNDLEMKIQDFSHEIAEICLALREVCFFPVSAWEGFDIRCWQNFLNETSLLTPTVSSREKKNSFVGS